jgi:hypothetical protein
MIAISTDGARSGAKGAARRAACIESAMRGQPRVYARRSPLRHRPGLSRRRCPHRHLARPRRHTAGARTRPRAFCPRKGGAGASAGQARPAEQAAGTSPSILDHEWDQNPGQALKLFESSNALPNRCRPLSIDFGEPALHTRTCLAYVIGQPGGLTGTEAGLRVAVVGARQVADSARLKSAAWNGRLEHRSPVPVRLDRGRLHSLSREPGREIGCLRPACGAPSVTATVIGE